MTGNVSPTTDTSAGNQQYGSTSRPQAVATSGFFTSPGMFLLHLLLPLILSGFPLTPGVRDVSYQTTESFSYLLHPATLGTMTLPSGPTEFGPCFRTPGSPPIPCPLIRQNFHRLRPLLLLGGFPLDRGPLSPHLTQDLDDYCPVTQQTGRSTIMQQDFYGRMVCTYDAHAASVIAEPPPPHVATIPVPPPAPIRLAYVLLQPWPPPVLLVLSAVKPGVYKPLSEGFKGEREISNTLLSLYFRV